MSVTANVSYLFGDLQRAGSVIHPCIFDELRRNGQCLKTAANSGMNWICDSDKVSSQINLRFSLE